LKNSSSIALPFDVSCRGSFFLSFFLGDEWLFPGGQFLLQMRIVQKTPCFASWYNLVDKRPTFVSTIDQVTTSAHAFKLVFRQEAWNAVLDNMRHVQIIRENFVASAVANPCCGRRSRLGAVGTHQRCNFFELESSFGRFWPIGMFIIFQTVSSMRKACAETRPKVFSLYAWLII
jgi:hypothetical protein